MSVAYRTGVVRFVLVLAAVAVLLACAAVVVANEWTRFQGPPRDFAAQEQPPAGWSPSDKIKWSADIPGYGQSSPVTWGGRVFVTSISGKNKEQGHVTAFDLKSGEKAWQFDFDTASGAENNNYVSKAAPSPAVDAAGLYCFFEGGNLFALSHDGQPLWQRNLVKEFGPIESRHGIAASLEQNAGQIFVWVEREKEPYLLCVEKKSGNTKWKVAGLGAASWASPRLVPVTKGEHLVLSGIGKIAGYNPADGKELWTFDEISGNSTPTPVPLGNGKFLIGATVGRGEAGGGQAAESNGCLAIQLQDDGKWKAEWAWQSKRATSSFGSPLAHAGSAYYVNAQGTLFCLDLATGEERYVERVADSIWATPLAIGDRLCFFGKGGKVSIVAAGEKFKLLGENAIWETKGPEQPPAAGGPPARMFGGPTLYAAILVNDQLLLRRGDKLYCVEAKK